MESFPPVKSIIASNISRESLQKYKEKISALPIDDRWSHLLPLCLYKGFWFSPVFLEGAMHAQDHFQAQPTDVYLCSSMKTGSTWLKSLSFAIVTRTRFNDSTTPLQTIVPHDCIPFLEYGEHSTAIGPTIPLFASHLPYNFLPKSVLDSDCKIVYLCRDPKDTFVSIWHFFHKVTGYNCPGNEHLIASIEEAFELFCKGLSFYGPYWDHVLGYWKASLDRPNKILFLKYEDMMKDTKDCVMKLAEFFGCPFSSEEEARGIVEKIINFCSFESLSNLEVNKIGKQVKKHGFVENSSYFRKGKVGDWRNYLTVEMGDHLDNILQEKLSGSGFNFHNT